MSKKRLLLLFLSLVTSAILIACGDATVKEVENDGSARFKGIDGKIEIITDSETGCKYIFVEDGIAQGKTEAMSPLVKDSNSFDCD